VQIIRGGVGKVCTFAKSYNSAKIFLVGLLIFSYFCSDFRKKVSLSFE